MKSSIKILFTVLILNSAISYAGIDEFIITVKSDNTGGSLNTQFTIPTFGIGYNYNVDCNNDGAFEAIGMTGDYTCDFIPFGGAGTYQIAIIGNQLGFEGFPRIYFNNTGDRLKVLSINQWGTNPWKNMRASFRGASNMTITATDVLDLSQVEAMGLMFSAAHMANPDTSLWDTSNVISMPAMFQNATSATPDVSNWDVSMVSNMGFMFAGATIANPKLSHWDISNSSDMTNLLGGTSISTINYDAMLVNFNSTLPTPPTGINLGNVPTSRCSQAAQSAYTNLMLTYNWTINDSGICTAANPANDFVIEVDTTIVGSTSNTQFEINTNTSNGEIYNYNVDCDSDNPGVNIATGQVGNYICNYTNPGVYTISISDNIGDKTGFPRLYSFGHNDAKKIVNIIQWSTGIWNSMESAFYNASNMVVSAVDIPDLSQVASMSYMFKGASLANPNTSDWNTANVTNMSYMFSLAASANPNTSNWNTSNVTDMSGMFNNAASSNPNVQSWDITNINGYVFSNMDDMFFGVTIPTASYDTMLAHFNSQAVQSGIIFSGGNSKYCNEVAHDNLTNVATGHGWTITDGGLDANCSDILFENSFEDMIVFKAAEKQFVYDFAEVSLNLDPNPLLIAKGVDAQNNTVIKIYLRNDMEQLQIRKDTIELNESKLNQWINGQWQNSDNNNLTVIQWQ